MAKGRTITTSPNISFLDFAALFDVPNLTLTLDLTPSVWVGTGYSSVQGVKFTITSPSGTALVGGGGTFDIVPPDMQTGTTDYNLIESFNSVEWGIYTVNTILTDQNGDEFAMDVAYFDLCRPKQKGNEEGTSDASMSLVLETFCRDGNAKADDKTVYAYKNTTVTTLVYNNKIYLDAELELANPFISTANPPPLTFDLYTGKTTFKSNVTATYDLADSWSVILSYVGSISKEVLCQISFCNVFCALAKLADEAIRKAATPDELVIKQNMYDILFNLEMVQLAIDCGYDQDRWVRAIEDLSGVSCGCDCVGRINPSPVSVNDDFNIVGTGSVTVTQATAGNTTTFSVNGKTYSVVYGGTQPIPEINISTTPSGNNVQIAVSLNLGVLRDYFEANMSIGGVLYQNQTATYIPNNTSEDTIYTYSLPAATGTNIPVNTASKDGDIVRWKFYFQNQLASNSNNRSIRIYLGATVIETLVLTSSAFDTVVYDIEIIRITQNTQMINIVRKQGGFSNTPQSVYINQVAGTANLAVTNVLKVTGQLASAVASSVLFYSDTVELVKKV